MAKFSVFETSPFLEDLDQNFSGQKDRIVRKLHQFVYPQLKENPFFGKNIKKLRNYQPETWRYRIGDYRFFYTIKGETIFMLAIDHRQGSY